MSNIELLDERTKRIFEGVEKVITGYSAKSLAQYYLNTLKDNTLVKQYKSCLTEIAG